MMPGHACHLMTCFKGRLPKMVGLSIAAILAATPLKAAEVEQEVGARRASPITALDVSPAGRLVAVTGRYEIVLLDFNAAVAGRWKVVRRLVGISQRIESLRFSPDGARLAAAGGAPGRFGEIQIWNVTDGQLLGSYPCSTDLVQGVSWSPDGTQVAFGDTDSKLRAIDARTGQQTFEQAAHTDWVLASAWSIDATHLISGSRDRSLKLSEVATGRFIDNITSVSPGVLGGGIACIDRHPRADIVVVGGADGVPRTFRLHREVERKIGDDSNLVRRYPAMPGQIFAARFAPDGNWFAAASSDRGTGHVHVFSVPPQAEISEAIRAIQTKTLAERTQEQRDRLDAYHAEGAERKVELAGEMGSVYTVAIHPSGQWIISGGVEGRLRIHRADDGRSEAEIMPPVAIASASTIEQASDLDTASDPVRFLTDVMPLLSKLGCNAGTCHGAAGGKNGFALSLRGYNPLDDWRTLTDDLAGRRIDRQQPAESLMLLKATGAVAHEAGIVLDDESLRYRTLLGWLRQGAIYDPQAPRVVSLALEPHDPVLDQPGEQQPLRVTATYTDGSQRDVTADAFIESSLTECATVDSQAVATAVRRGEAPLLARYEGAYASTTVTVMGDRQGFRWSDPPAYNAIDELVYRKLQRMKISVAELCTDEEFLRRVYLDLTGLPPTAEAVRAFCTDEQDSRLKREALVKQLLASEEYVEHWTNHWADLLLVNGQFLGREGATRYHEWIRAAISENRAYDQMVRQILTASGSNHEQPAASFLKILRTPERMMEASTMLFLGVRFSCNRCHDHPFERWTQDDYYSLAAFFADVTLEKDPESGESQIPGSAVAEATPLVERVADGENGMVMHERTGQPAVARFPFEHEFAGADQTSRRAQFAAWLTAPENRYFASTYVNRVWARLLGIGLIEPVDDIRAGNPPSNPELLASLTEQFIDSRFDTRALIESICQSRTYQLAMQTDRWNQDDSLNYSHAVPRRLPAEVLLDAAYQVTGATTQFPDVPAGTRAAALPDVSIRLASGFLDRLGRPARESGCQCERSNNLDLGAVMALVNGPALAEALADPQNAIARLEAEIASDDQLVEAIFLRVLNRWPTAAESELGRELLAKPEDLGESLTAQLQEQQRQLANGYLLWQRENKPIDWDLLVPEEFSSTNGALLLVQPDQSVLVSGNQGQTTTVIRSSTELRKIRGVRLELLADERLPHRGPGRSKGDGNVVLSELVVQIAPLDRPDRLRRVKLRAAQADFSQSEYEVYRAIDGKNDTGWSVAGQTGQDHQATFEFLRPLGFKGGSLVVVELEQQYADGQHGLGRFRLSLTGDPPPLLRHVHPAPMAEILSLPAKERSEAQAQQLTMYYLSNDPIYRELRHATNLVANPRLTAAQDLVWALINSPAFLFNH